MRSLLAAALALSALTACDQVVAPSGTITVKNEDGQKWPLLITNEAACTLGLRTSINGNTQTTFDVDLAGAWMCVNEEGPPIPVEAGKSYAIEGGRVITR